MEKIAVSPYIREDQKENTKDIEDTKDRGAAAEAEHARNANSRMIFGNPVLACQFLKEYTDLPIFSEITPEDIEDVSERYRAFLGVEFEGDTVKKVKVRRGEGEEEVYVVSLIEHKSSVDHDAAMQLLRYMVLIWYDYAKKQNTVRKDASKRKKFRYPMIVPVVYYEGASRWTADLHLADRIGWTEDMRQYVPDFTYKLVSLREYTQEELEKRQDEMSLVMLFNRIQSPEDLAELLKLSGESLNGIYTKAPAEVKKVCSEVIWSLLMKMNVPADEAHEMMNRLEDDGMGELFANMEKMDIQEERRKRAEAEQKLAETKQKLERAEQKVVENARRSEQELAEAKQKLKRAEQKAVENARRSEQELTEAKQKATQELMEARQKAAQELMEARQKAEHEITNIAAALISAWKKLEMTKEEAAAGLHERCGIPEEKAAEMVEQFWERDQN